MIISAGHNLQIHLSRNDGQVANTLTQIIGTVARAGFQIREAVLHEQRERASFVVLRAWFKGRSIDEAAALRTAMAALGQNAPFPTI